MTDKAHPEDDAPNATFLHRENSSTAATIGDNRYRAVKGQTYRVTLVGGMGMMNVDVAAMTGDEAAELALKDHQGCKVAHVAPAPQKQVA